MRRFIYPVIALLFLITNSLTAQTWHTDLATAQSQAEEEHKSVMLVFQGSDWCGPCIKLHKEVWESDAFEEFSKEHLIPVKVDFPKRKQNALLPEQVAHNEALAELYNPSGIFPLVVIVDVEGTVLGKTGYKNIGTTAYLNHLNSFLQ